MLKSLLLSALALCLSGTLLASDAQEREASVRHIQAEIAEHGGYRAVVDATKAGDASALYLLSELRRAGLEGDDADWLTPLREAAEAGHLEARSQYADIDADNLSAHADKKRAAAGQEDAMRQLWNRYRTGNGVPEDRDLALYYLAKAEPAGAGTAWHPDLTVSLDAIHHRIRMGDATALRELAALYLNGWVVQRDEAKAIRLLEVAAPSDPVARELLRNHYRK